MFTCIGPFDMSEAAASDQCTEARPSAHYRHPAGQPGQWPSVQLAVC